MIILVPASFNGGNLVGYNLLIIHEKGDGTVYHYDKNNGAVKYDVAGNMAFLKSSEGTMEIFVPSTINYMITVPYSVT